MKLRKNNFKLLFFCENLKRFLFVFCCAIVFCFSSLHSFVGFKICNAMALPSADIVQRNYEIEASGRKFYYSSASFKNEISFSNSQKIMMNNYDKSVELLKNMGLSNLEIVKFLCPESDMILKRLENIFNSSEIQEHVYVNKNKCSLTFDDGKPEVFINKQEFFENIFCFLTKNNPSFKLTIKLENFKSQKNLRKLFVEKSSFSTNFKTSSSERKNNIKTALSAFDGLVLDDGEVLSFNETTGIRDEKSGYKQAKIISNGTFVLGYGGGVCQVSTTLYNACLLSGLEILEVHGHSLPVSYVEPSFDAMVNTGSSDLVIRNNSGGKIIFTTSSENDVCKVKIFGLKNKYKITRFSEKIKIIPAITENSNNETIHVSYPKNGYISNGYLNYYDSSGNLIMSKRVRNNDKYNPPAVKNGA